MKPFTSDLQYGLPEATILLFVTFFCRAFKKYLFTRKIYKVCRIPEAKSGSLFPDDKRNVEQHVGWCGPSFVSVWWVISKFVSYLNKLPPASVISMNQNFSFNMCGYFAMTHTNCTILLWNPCDILITSYNGSTFSSVGMRKLHNVKPKTVQTFEKSRTLESTRPVFSQDNVGRALDTRQSLEIPLYNDRDVSQHFACKVFNVTPLFKINILRFLIISFVFCIIKGVMRLLTRLTFSLLLSGRY